ncbi:MAG: adenylate/guanylate cyclase domain-containing protein [Planctomycetota bacterium]|jgi:adenylate cyclase|nr:adenylate/guanylate cyclase domain-containing protein [Planctomycetota bacterium]
MPASTTKIISPNKRQTLPHPLLLGLLVVIVIAAFNHIVFIHNFPSNSLSDSASSLIYRSNPTTPESSTEERGMFSALFDGLCRVILMLDIGASEILISYTHYLDTGDNVKIAVITVDEASLNQIGAWPWSRRTLTDLFSHLKSAAVIGLNSILNEDDRTSLKYYVESISNLFGLDIAQDISLVDPLELDNDLLFSRTLTRLKTVEGLFLFNLSDGSHLHPKGAKLPFNISAVLPSGDKVDLANVFFRQANAAIANLPVLRRLRNEISSEGFVNLFANYSGLVQSIPLFISHTDDTRTPEDESGIYPSLPLEMVRMNLGATDYVIHLTGRQQVINLLGRRQTGTNSAIDPSVGPFLMDHISLVRRVGDTSENLLDIRVNEFGEMIVRPRFFSSDTFQIYPAWEVLDGRHNSDFSDSYVLFDVTALSTSNVQTSFLSADSIPGVFVQARMINDIVQGNFITHRLENDYYWQQFLILLSGIAISLAFTYGGNFAGVISFFGIIVVATVGVQVLVFRRGALAGQTMPIFASMVVIFSQFLLSYFIDKNDRSFIRNAFSRSVSPSILEFLAKNPERISSIGGEQRNMTVLFSDIRGFTAISEVMTAGKLARFLNEYLTPMSDLVMKNMGTVDKFIGDAIMAFWNAPTDDPEHAKNTARTALEMLKCLEDMQESWSQRGLPKISIGCGINSGPMFAGYMGSEQRKNYTVMGDNVNIASRLEGLNKLYSTNIIISQSTRETLGASFFCRVLDKVRVSGRLGPVTIYELLGEGIPDEALYEEVVAFDRVFTLYQKREFVAATSLLQELISIRSSPIYDLYMNRLAVYSALPPPPEWDGVYTVNQK